VRQDETLRRCRVKRGTSRGERADAFPESAHAFANQRIGDPQEPVRSLLGVTRELRIIVERRRRGVEPLEVLEPSQRCVDDAGPVFWRPEDDEQVFLGQTVLAKAFREELTSGEGLSRFPASQRGGRSAGIGFRSCAERRCAPEKRRSLGQRQRGEQMRHEPGCRSGVFVGHAAHPLELAA
jgi:hypothetical protein